LYQKTYELARPEFEEVPEVFHRPAGKGAGTFGVAAVSTV